MAIEQQRVHVAGRRAGLADLEEIRLAAILLLDRPRRGRMSELDLGFANPLHHGDECSSLAPVDYHKPKRNSDKAREHDKRAAMAMAILHDCKGQPTKPVKRQKKKLLIYCLSWERAQAKGGKKLVLN